MRPLDLSIIGPPGSPCHPLVNSGSLNHLSTLNMVCTQYLLFFRLNTEDQFCPTRKKVFPSPTSP
jgi:hypothetical protein